MDGTIQNYTLDMAADTKKDPLEIKLSLIHISEPTRPY